MKLLFSYHAAQRMAIGCLLEAGSFKMFSFSPPTTSVPVFKISACTERTRLHHSLRHCLRASDNIRDVCIFATRCQSTKATIAIPIHRLLSTRMTNCNCLCFRILDFCLSYQLFVFLWFFFGDWKGSSFWTATIFIRFVSVNCNWEC